MKLQEGNVFIVVCLFIRGVSTWDLGTNPPSPRYGSWVPTTPNPDIRPGDLFKLVHLRPYPEALPPCPPPPLVLRSSGATEAGG